MSKKNWIYKLLTTTIMCLFPLAASSQGLLQRYKQCVNAKRAELEKPVVKEAYRDRGCRTDPTDSVTGARDGCNENICYEAAPNNLIVDARVWDHSARGSEHSYGPTQYLPTRDFATRFCNTVQARSPSGRGSGRGWQKLSADVTLKRQITDAEREAIEASCEREVLN